MLLKFRRGTIETSIFQSEVRLQGLAQAAGYDAEKLAALCCWSPRHFRRLFQANRSCSPQEWLSDLMVTEAMKHLAAGKASKQVGSDLGFKHLSSFCRWFKHSVGVSPVEYAASFKGETSKRLKKMSDFANSSMLNTRRDSSELATENMPGAKQGNNQRKNLSGVVRSELEALKEQFVRCFNVRNNNTSVLRETVKGLISQGVTRKTLVSWAVQAGYTKSYVSSLLSQTLCSMGLRANRLGAGRKPSLAALELLDHSRLHYGKEFLKVLRAAWRAGKAQLAKEDPDARIVAPQLSRSQPTFNTAGNGKVKNLPDSSAIH